MKLHTSGEDYLKTIYTIQKGKGTVRSVDVAEKLYERHQYFREQLTGVGVDATTAEAEACKMEHTISDDSFQKLKGQEQMICPFADSCDFKLDKERGP